MGTAKARACPACHKRIHITAAMSGRVIHCPHCHHKLKVPGAPASAGKQESADSTVEAAATPSTADSGAADNEGLVSSNVAARANEVVIDTRSDRPVVRRRRRSWAPAAMAVLVISCFGIVAWTLSVLLNTESIPALKRVSKLTVIEGQPLSWDLALVDPHTWKNSVRYRLINGPKGAELNADTGRFSWTPDESQGPGTFEVTVQVHSTENTDQASSVIFSIVVREHNEKPTLELPTEDQMAEVGEALLVTLTGNDGDEPARRLKFSLTQSPSDATIDEGSGMIRWTPSRAMAGKKVPFVVQLSELGEDGLSVTGSFNVVVGEITRPVDQLARQLEQSGLNVQVQETRFKHAFHGSGVTLLVDGKELRVIEYASEEESRAESMQIASHRDQFSMPELPESWVGPMRYYRLGQVLAIYAGLDEELHNQLVGVLGRPIPAVGPERSESAAAMTGPAEEPFGPFTADDGKQLLALYDNGQLFRIRNYDALRNMFASRFEREQEEIIRTAFGPAYDELTQWLDEHLELKVEFYNAIDPETDRVANVLQIFRSLWETFPDQIASYGNLAIAVSITWDDPRAVTMHVGPMRQGKATPPEHPTTALENFKYFLDGRPFMQGRARFLPWEFLVHAVNQTTPIAERQWAAANYLARRSNIGSCYKDVPYDHGMLDSGNETGRIHGKVYTLPNLRQFGGVCAHQGDFAARVSKSLGVPAAYVTGESRYGGHHAWVMWVELQSVSATGIQFSLESFGRYRGDKYYVGNLREPHSARRITDRQLELSLHTVGLNPRAQRQARMIMEVFPLIQEDRSLDVVHQFLFLRDTLDLCAGNQQAWSALAKMSSDPEVRTKHRKDMAKITDLLFLTFARFPDFTWTVFDDLIQYEEELDERIKLYGRLVGLYELQGRPDLACEARLRLADMLVENNQATDAITGLAFSIKKFPGEGRYVPRMLDKLETICGKVDGAQKLLIPFYSSFLPMIPTARGSRPSKYCITMHERGIKLFESAGQVQLAQIFSVQLARIKEGNP